MGNVRWWGWLKSYLCLDNVGFLHAPFFHVHVRDHVRVLLPFLLDILGRYLEEVEVMEGGGGDIGITPIVAVGRRCIIFVSSRRRCGPRRILVGLV